MKTAHRLSVLIIWLTFCVTLMAQPNAWINEFHYDNEGGDVGEFVEVAVPAELSDKQDLRLCLYNGANGERYDSYHSLDEFIQGGAAGNHILYYTYIDGIQNGPDGLCLDYKGTVIQFLSYEGHFTAMDGPAAGLNSQDIGIQESGSTPLSGSLGLVGDGMNYSEFVWQVLTATPGMPNTDQSLPVELMSFQAEYKDHAIELTWRTASETNCLGFYIERGDSVQGYKRLSNMIQAAGTTSQMQSYAWRDTRIMPNRNYDYQLVEKDGAGSDPCQYPSRCTDNHV
ncbi:MAG: hypothetical protein U5R06_04625 [candidate division KSB1 bacterium]|nr:hypothetical protein [candidate division KSB1 bacterium]